MRTTLTLLVHGESGIGKSWLADTAPGPKLVLDAEGRAKFTPSGPKIGWDVRSGPPPVYDGTWETCIAPVPDFDSLSLAYQWLRSGQHGFVSVVVDSLMEAQKRCIDQAVGVNALQQQDWGTVLRKLENLVRSYRDLTLVPSSTVACVVFIVGTKDYNGTLEPLLQGQLRDTVPYYIDVVGYYYKQPILSDGVATSYQRNLLIDSVPGFRAKDNTDRLIRAYPSGVIPEPNIAALMELLHINGAPAAIDPTHQVAAAIATSASAQEGVA